MSKSTDECLYSESRARLKVRLETRNVLTSKQ